MTPSDAPRKRGRRRWKRWALASVLTVVAAVVSVPWLASTAPARLGLVRAANGTLAPSRVELAAQSFSWIGPQELRGLVLRDRAGKVLLSVSRVRVGRSLLGLAMGRPLRTSVRLDGAALSVERRADGSIDLLDALGPLLGGGAGAAPARADDAGSASPATASQGGPDLDIKVAGGSLTVRSPELAEPLVARRFEMAVRVPSNGPTSWRIALAEPAEGDDASLKVDGELAPGAGGSSSSDMTATVVGGRWPLAVRAGGVATRARLDGKFRAARKADQWSVSGDGQVLDLDAAGPALAGDRLRLDRTTVACDAAMSGGTWDVRRLDVACPLGSLKAVGRGSLTSATPVSSRLEGRLDLAALARQLPHALHVREGLAVEQGSATLQVDLDEDAAAGSSRFVVEAGLSDMVAHDGTRKIVLRNPAGLSAQLVRQGDNLRVDRLDLKTAFLNATGQGDLKSGVTVSASIDLAGLKSQLQDVLDFGGLELSGHGRLGADYRRAAGGTYVARFAAELKDPRVAGLTTEPIARKALRLDAAGSGPADDSGLPAAWSQAKLTLVADDLNAGAKLSTRDPAQSILIEDLHLVVPMTAGGQFVARNAEAIRFAAEGRYEPARGLLELRPSSGNPRSEPVALGLQGVKVQGLGGVGPLHIASELTGDLARLDRALAWWTGSQPMDLAGSLTAKTGFAFHPNGELTIAATLDSPDLSLPGAPGAPRRAFGPAILAAGGSSPAGRDQIALKNIAMAFRYGQLHGSGSLIDPAGRRVVELQGTLAPNWTTVDPLMAQSLEPGARVRGEFRPFRVHGPLAAGGLVAVLRGLDAEFGVDRFEALAFGVRVAPTPVVLHWRGAKGVIEPIETTVNGGRASLRPDLVIDDSGTLSLRIADGSMVQNAEINENVSHSLLSYIAPVLRDATKVRGKVSMNISRAEFPLLGDESRHTTLLGRVEFNDVVFTAGRFADELLSLTGKGGGASVRLQQPVELTIADGRVTQRGLAVPLGRDARIELEGSVGFDQTLAMKARVPVPRGVLGNRPEIADLAEALRVGVPIGGTLSRPTIDRRALRVGLGEAGRSVLERGAADLIKGLSRPRESRPPRGFQNP